MMTSRAGSRPPDLYFFAIWFMLLSIGIRTAAWLAHFIDQWPRAQTAVFWIVNIAWTYIAFRYVVVRTQQAVQGESADASDTDLASNSP